MTIETVIDFGEAKIFDATVEPYVLIGCKTFPILASKVEGHNLFPLLARELNGRGSVESVREQIYRLDEHLKTEVSIFPQRHLTTAEWRIEDEDINSLFERLMNEGTSLGDFVENRLYMGVKTGLNKAFVIDRNKRDELIEEDPRSAEIIKPWLRGKDIGRWKAKSAGLYIIAMQNSGDDDINHPWERATSNDRARAIFRDTYPAIHDHLSFFERSLKVRQDQGKRWWELRACAYYHEFARPKIVWPDIAREVRFAGDSTGSYLGNTGYIMPTEAKWLLALLNANLIEFLLCQITNSLRGGFLRLIHQYVTQLPIVTPGPGTHRRLESIALMGIAGEQVDEDELNGLVYDLYGLSRDERRLIVDWFERRSLVVGSDDRSNGP